MHRDGGKVTHANQCCMSKSSIDGTLSGGTVAQWHDMLCTRCDIHLHLQSPYSAKGDDPHPCLQVNIHRYISNGGEDEDEEEEEEEEEDNMGMSSKASSLRLDKERHAVWR